MTDLSAAKRYEDVVSLIEQALIAGQSQPWMFEVLALTMEIAGRPREQIERVLLSSRDLTPGDVPSLLFLASYLARFERFEPALRCCRQAAALEPARSEPYVIALRLATRAKRADDAAWAAVGVLTYAWGPDRQTQQQLAENAAADVRQQWLKAGRVTDAAELDRQLAEARRRDLQVRLDWSGAGDLDLIVEEPQGTVCSREQATTRGGGVFVHDGSGPEPENCYDEYVCPRAWPGEYRVRIRHSGGAIVGKRARLTVIRNAGGEDEQRDVIPVAVAAEDQIVRVTLRSGRREQAAAVLPAVHQELAAAGRRPTVVQQLQAANFVDGQVRPFNVGAAPVGGGVGYQPVIQFFNEGVTMSALATVSGDRRYVRIRTVPVFSSITDVFTFSFINGGGNPNGGGGGGTGPLGR